MVDIYTDVAAAGFPAYQQGAAPKDLPEEFVTVWEDYSGGNSYGDNKPHECRHEWSLIFYTTKTENIFNGLKTVIDALKKRGYLIDGQGHDASGTFEGYDARAVDVVFIEDLEV